MRTYVRVSVGWIVSPPRDSGDSRGARHCGARYAPSRRGRRSPIARTCPVGRDTSDADARDPAGVEKSRGAHAEERAQGRRSRMAVKGADLESELIDTVCERIRERLPADQQQPCEAFVRQYYQWVPPEDLADRNPLDLYGAAVAHWNLAQQRAPGEAKVRVYNPDFEQHGWQSPHTLIEIVSDDMPFIVDSVTMDMTRKGYSIHLVIHPVMRIRRDENGQIVDVLDPESESGDALPESILHAEVGR